MLKQALLYSLLIVLLASCSSLKTAFTGNQQTASFPNSTSVKKETKFLDQTDMPVGTNKTMASNKSESATVAGKEVKAENKYFDRSDATELSSLQIKYAVLLNTPAEEVRNTKMFEFIDDWYVHLIIWAAPQKKELIAPHFPNFFLQQFMV